MTNAPADLLAHRSVMAGITGLTNPSDIGIVGNGAHQRTGGYHEGKDVLTANGMYHPPASSHVGSTGEDYSCRIARDRNGLTNSASAVDYGDNWPHGGRAAWIRFNNALVAALHANVPSLGAIRAVNYTPDGAAKKRTDRQAGWSVVSSSDSVDIHTHVEYYRDTEGQRQATLDAVAQLARAAISNISPTPNPPSGGNVSSTNTDAFIAAYRTGSTTASDGGHVEPVNWRIRDETWQSQVNATLADIQAKIAQISTGGISQDQLNAAVKIAMSDPGVLAAVATAVADENYRRQAS